MRIPVKWRRRRRGAHRNVLGRASGKLSCDRRIRSSNSKNGLSTASRYNLSRSVAVTVRLIELTRSDRLSAVMILTSSSGDGGSSARELPYSRTIGRGGQQSKVFETGVPNEQNSRRCRACWDVNTICRHLRHICTSLGQRCGDACR